MTERLTDRYVDVLLDLKAALERGERLERRELGVHGHLETLGEEARMFWARAYDAADILYGAAIRSEMLKS